MEKAAKNPGNPKWHHTPPLPLVYSPYYDWPLKPLRSALYLLNSWKPVTWRFIMFLMAVVIGVFFAPDPALTATWSLEWVGPLWLRNFIILFGITGALHVFLLVAEKQGHAYQFDQRGMAKNARLFFFGNQVLDNMLWTFCALQFWVLVESFVYWCWANGIGMTIDPLASPIAFAAIVIFIPVWAVIYFYFHHRILHTPFLYKHVHNWHHKNINTGPFSGLAMHPVESFILFTDVVIFLIIPGHPVLLTFLMLHHGVGAPTSHAGFERLKLFGGGEIQLGDFFHQLHHRYLDCNYGAEECPLDQWFGTFHDGTQEGDALLQNRRAARTANR